MNILQPLIFIFGGFAYAATSSPSCTVFVKTPANALANTPTAFLKLSLPIKFVCQLLSVYDYTLYAYLIIVTKSIPIHPHKLKERLL